MNVALTFDCSQLESAVEAVREGLLPLPVGAFVGVLCNGKVISRYLAIIGPDCNVSLRHYN